MYHNGVQGGRAPLPEGGVSPPVPSRKGPFRAVFPLPTM